MVVALVVAAAFAAPARGQPGPPWPDGEWVGAISGSGSASGVLEGRAGVGTASASGGFTVDIVDGEATGGYGVNWVGQGESVDGNSGEVVIEETGFVQGENGQPLLIRESFTGTVTADGFTIPLPAGALDPAPTPLIAEHIDCGMIEGYFVGKLSALADSLRTFGITAASEESFVALAGTASDSSFDAAYTAAADRLGDLQTGLIQLEIIATADNVAEMLADMETILAEAEEIIAGLDGIEGCELIGAAQFRLGITDAADALLTRLFELAGGDPVMLQQLAINSVRSGVSGSIVLRDAALAAITDAVASAEAAEDKDALRQLAVAALSLGLTDEYDRIVAICERISS